MLSIGQASSLVLWLRVNYIPNDKFLDWSRWKALADDKINVIEKLKFVLRRVENIVGKAKNAGYLPAFSPISSLFSKGFFSKVVKNGDCVVKS